MTVVVDRRNESSKGRASRDRLINRTKSAARDAINQSIKAGNITDIGKNGIDVTVPKGGLSEPTIHHDKGGINENVLPGNDNEEARFRAGDRIPKPKGGGKGLGGKSPDGEGQDSFIYHLSEEEFLNILFDDLELPNLFKLGADDDQKKTLEHAGFSHSGPFNRLSLVRSKQAKITRELVMNRGINQKLLELLAEEKEILSKYLPKNSPKTLEKNVEQESLSSKIKVKLLNEEISFLKQRFLTVASPADQMRVQEIDTEIAPLNERRYHNSKWRERDDLIFRTVEEQPLPTSKAVMVCEMDVSGSMSEEMKSQAKIFFFLLNRFLRRQYDQVDVVFVRYHSSARETEEREFFEGTDTGGTRVAFGHKKVIDILTERYPQNEWNIYGAQASDGDTGDQLDEILTKELMKIMLPMMQGFFSVEVGNHTRTSDLWRIYQPLTEEYSDRFWIGRIKDKKDIWPVFRKLFIKREGNGNDFEPRSAAFAPS